VNVTVISLANIQSECNDTTVDHLARLTRVIIVGSKESLEEIAEPEGVATDDDGMFGTSEDPLSKVLKTLDTALIEGLLTRVVSRIENLIRSICGAVSHKLGSFARVGTLHMRSGARSSGSDTIYVTRNLLASRVNKDLLTGLVKTTPEADSDSGESTAEVGGNDEGILRSITAKDRNNIRNSRIIRGDPCLKELSEVLCLLKTFMIQGSIEEDGEGGCEQSSLTDSRLQEAHRETKVETAVEDFIPNRLTMADEDDTLRTNLGNLGGGPVNRLLPLRVLGCNHLDHTIDIEKDLGMDCSEEWRNLTKHSKSNEEDDCEKRHEMRQIK